MAGRFPQSQRMLAVALILGNPEMIAAYRSGSPGNGTSLFPTAPRWLRFTLRR